MANEERGGIGISTFIMPLNPKPQFWGWMAIPNYLIWGSKGAAAYTPVFSLLSFLPGMHVETAGEMLTSPSAFARGVFGGIPLSGGTPGMAKTLGKIAAMEGDALDTFANKATGVLTDYMKKTKIANIRGSDIIKMLKTSGLVDLTKNPELYRAARRAAGAMMTTAKAVSNFSYFMTGVLGGIQVGQIISSGIGLAFKGSISAMQYVKSQTEHMRNLEIGGSLSAGYMMEGAVSERQRALAEIKRSHIPGRPAFGNEASFYSKYI